MAESEKFSISGVKGKMQTIEGYFTEFATTLDQLNAFIETNVNASLESSAYGELGGRLINIWDYNAATFQDFHENFDNWAQTVAIIAANNSEFAVDANATYRDNAGTLDGVQEARSYVSSNNGVSNSGSNYAQLSNDAKAIIDSSIDQGSTIPEAYNIFGGKTIVAEDGSIEYYDKDNKLIAKRGADGLYYDGDNNLIGDGSYGDYRKWLIENGYTKSIDKVLNEKNNFGGQTVEKEDGSLEFYDQDGKLIAKKIGDTYYDANGQEIGDAEAYNKWLTDNNHSTADTVISEQNEFGGKTVQEADGTIVYRDKNGDVAVTYKGGKYYTKDGTEIGDQKAFDEWLKENAPKEGQQQKPEGGQQQKPDDKQTPDGGKEVKPPEITEKNEFGGKTEENPDGSITIYDKDHNVVATYRDGKYYDKNDKEIPDYEKFVEDNKPQQPDDKQTPDGGEEVKPPEITEKNEFGGKTEENSDGSITIYDKDNNVVATYRDGKYFDKNNKEIPDYDKFLEDNKPKGGEQPEGKNGEEAGEAPESGQGPQSEGGSPAPEETEQNEFGGRTVKESDGSVVVYDKDNNVVAKYRDGKYYDRNDKEIPDYDKFLEDNKPKGGEQPEGKQGGDAGGAPESGQGPQSEGGSPAPEETERNDFGGRTIKESDGSVVVYDKDNNVVAKYRDGKYYDRNDKEIPDYNKFVEDNKPQGGKPQGGPDQTASDVPNSSDHYGSYTTTTDYGSEVRHYPDGSYTTITETAGKSYHIHYTADGKNDGYEVYDSSDNIRESITVKYGGDTNPYTTTYYNKDGSIKFTFDSETFESGKYNRLEYPDGKVIYQCVVNGDTKTITEEEYYDVVGRG